MIRITTRITGIDLLKPAVLVLLSIYLFSCQTSEENFDDLQPEENGFTTSNLNQPGSLDEPMAFTFLDNEEMLIVVQTVATLPVNTIYTNKEGRSRSAEEGLMGIIAHPDYADKHWIFMLYADPTGMIHSTKTLRRLFWNILSKGQNVVIPVAEWYSIKRVTYSSQRGTIRSTLRKELPT